MPQLPPRLAFFHLGDYGCRLAGRALIVGPYRAGKAAWRAERARWAAQHGLLLPVQGMTYADYTAAAEAAGQRWRPPPDSRGCAASSDDCPGSGCFYDRYARGEFD